jgi:hypothetical protein
MRGDSTRTWLRRSDMIAAIAEAGIFMTWWDARKAMRSMPRPEKRYGHYRYTVEHLDAVLAYGRRMYEEVVA